MSAYTEARSRPGAASGGADDNANFLIEFGGMVVTAYEEVMDYQEYRYVKPITQGKADTFPIIGRKRDASEHVPGELILGGGIDHDQITITLDQVIVDSAFIAEIDELKLHYSIREPYATQIGQSLGVTTARRIAIMHILASRDITTSRPGQPVPAYYWAADLKTNPAKLEDACFQTRTYLEQNDISGSLPMMFLGWQQYFMLARYAGIEEGATSGTGNRAQGTVGKVAGLLVKGTNHCPTTVISTGNPKYQGDFSTTVGHVSTRMAVGTLERRGLRMTMTDQKDRLGTLLIGSMLNGHGKLRNECAIELRTDAIAGRLGLGL